MFTPDEKSRTAVIYAYTREHMTEVGDMLTYEEAFGLLDLEPVPDAGSAFASLISKVNARLARDGDWRHLQNAVGAGYRIASPAELREETLGRMRHVERQQIATQRAIEKVIRHPDATVVERKRATDAAASLAALRTLVRREQRKVRNAWPKDEQSPVVTEQ
jgi:hypothetical protein